MNTKQWMIVAGCFLALIVIISLTTTTVLPYSSDSLFSKEYTYEGMGAIVNTLNSGGVSKAEVNVDTKITNKKSPRVTLPFGKKGRRDGFETLSEASSSYNSPSPSLDFMSELPSSGSCVSTYSNSRGYICLDKKAIQLLTTRGGNMSTGEAQIG